MTSKTHNRILFLALAGIALRAMIPVGYMPAPVAEGLPFVLCHGRFPGAALFISAGETRHHAAHGHGDGNKPAPGMWEFCPFGVALGSSIPISEFVALLPAPEHRLEPLEPDYVVQSIFSRTHRARAPPTDRPFNA